MRWPSGPNLRVSLGTPPLDDLDSDERTVLDPKGKAEIFLRTLLEKAPRTNPPVEAGPAYWGIPLSNELTKDEIEVALLRIASTALRTDMITTDVIKVG